MHHSAVDVKNLWSAIAAITFLVLVALLALACTGGEPVSVVDNQDSVNILLTHRAGGGSFENLGYGTYRLTLFNVAAQTTYAAEQPEPASGQTATSAVMKEFNWNPVDPPIAAVVITDPAVSDTQDVLLVRLMSPVYNESLATLSFDVQIETNYRGQNLLPYVAHADLSLPASFGQVSVVVDSIWHHFTCGKGYIQCYLHYGCCSQPFVTQPLGSFKVSKCWSWGSMACIPCSNDPCAPQFPDYCVAGNCYTSCLDADDCTPD